MRFVDFNRPVGISDYDSGRRSLKLFDTETDETIRFQIPKLYMPFGISGFEPQFGPVKYNIDFSLKGYDEPGSYVNKFYSFVRTIEKQVTEYVVEHSEKIFNKRMTYEEVSELFNSNIKESSGDRDPKFRVKLDTKGENIKIPVFDKDSKRVEDVKAEMGKWSKRSGIAVVEVVSVYFLNKMIGLTWKIQQLKIFDPYTTPAMTGCQFIEED